MDKYKILIVEDDTDINHLLRRILEKNNYDTVQAFSGTEAKLLIQMETPDFLILDLMLPGMSGEELIQAVRGEMGLTLPILVLSAKAALNSKVEALRSGADAVSYTHLTGSVFRHDGIVEKVNPFKQTGMAKELGIDISDGKRLF